MTPCSTCKWREPRPDRRTCEACAAYQRTQRVAHKLRRRAWFAVPENRRRLYEVRRTEYHADPRPQLVSSARVRAKRAGVPFALTVADITIPTTCPLLGIPIEVGHGVTARGSPSIDRIVPALGYVRGNVWIISHRANTIKSDATLEELERVVSNLRRSNARAA